MTISRALQSALLVALVLVAGCATGPQVGVRDSYNQIRLETTTVVPFFARSQFSLASPTLDQRLLWAQSVAIEWLQERGVRVLSPDRTRDRLTDASMWHHFSDGGLLRRDLARSFESADRDQQTESQTELVRQLRDDDHLDSQYVLFGEVLYHSAGTCHTRADDHTDRARVVVDDGVSPLLPRPCVVTHVQARLIDTDSGSTVWYNRRMREWHVPKAGDMKERQNIRKAVRETIGGTDGLGQLFGGKQH